MYVCVCVYVDDFVCVCVCVSVCLSVCIALGAVAWLQSRSVYCHSGPKRGRSSTQHCFRCCYLYFLYVSLSLSLLPLLLFLPRYFCLICLLSVFLPLPASFILPVPCSICSPPPFPFLLPLPAPSSLPPLLPTSHPVLAMALRFPVTAFMTLLVLRGLYVQMHDVITDR